MIINADMAELGKHRAAFQDQCLTLIEQARFMPRELYVKQPEALALLEPIAKRLGIKLKQVYALPMLDHARESMTNFFQGF